MDHKSVEHFEAGDWEVCFQLLVEENSGKTTESGLAKRKKGLDRSVQIWERLWKCVCGDLIHTWYYFVLFLKEPADQKFR